MQTKLDLAALVGSRICHDLISPIGAIGNGVELFLMDTAATGPELSLITESIGHANARIRFFRIAFGASTTEQRIARSEVLSILTAMTAGSRLTVHWVSPAELPRRDVKLVFLLILCCESALPIGGTITVERDLARWTLSGTGTKLRLDPVLWKCLISPQTGVEIGPAQVQFLLAPEEIARQHRRLTADLTDREIRLSF